MNKGRKTLNLLNNHWITHQYIIIYYIIKIEPDPKKGLIKKINTGSNNNVSTVKFYPAVIKKIAFQINIRFRFTRVPGEVVSRVIQFLWVQLLRVFSLLNTLYLETKEKVKGKYWNPGRINLSFAVKIMGSWKIKGNLWFFLEN